MNKRKTTLRNWMHEVTTTSFQRLYLRIHQQEMFRRNSRKNLLILSVAYAAVMFVLAVTIF